MASEAAAACADKRTFKKKAPAVGGERSFVQFVLEPLYKIYAQVIAPCNMLTSQSLLFCLTLIPVCAQSAAPPAEYMQASLLHLPFSAG